MITYCLYEFHRQQNYKTVPNRKLPQTNKDISQNVIRKGFYATFNTLGKILKILFYQFGRNSNSSNPFTLFQVV